MTFVFALSTILNHQTKTPGEIRRGFSCNFCRLRPPCFMSSPRKRGSMYRDSLGALIPACAGMTVISNTKDSNPLHPHLRHLRNLRTHPLPPYNDSFNKKNISQIKQ